MSTKKSSSKELSSSESESEWPQEVLHRYYQKVGHSKSTGGVEHHGDILKKFSSKEQDVIRDFLKSVRYRHSKGSKQLKQVQTTSEDLESSDYEQDVIHRYYQKVGHSKATHGVHHHGDIIRTFDPDEQRIIRSFLREIRLGGHETETTKLKKHSAINDKSGYEQDVLHRYYHDISTSSGKSRHGHVLNTFNPREQKIIRNFLREIRYKPSAKVEESESESESESEVLNKYTRKNRKFLRKFLQDMANEGIVELRELMPKFQKLKRNQ
ncbi:unnamed protein product [Brachionus calyciflorus]|uniref:Uncharacterized protein n=1 Tax=Brachionus calyciflorus TaxID=104777 RepID=A0A814DDS2_9BILA|nr:unnamed protein product [Brachionus calyciflorus]